MKRYVSTASLGLCAVLFATGAAAEGIHRPYDGDSYYDYAKVVRVEPISRTVRVSTPQRECWDEEVTRYEHYRGARSESYTPMIVGGILGGVVGNQLGKGSGRDAMTIAGTLLGGSIGRDHGRHYTVVSRPYTVEEQHCNVHNAYYEEERIEGYRVTYRYRGREYITRMDHDPGNRIRVRLTVAAVAR